MTTEPRNPRGLREISRTIASLIILSTDERLLMGRKDPTKGGVYGDVWHIPGGGVDEGETLEAAARREAREEVGLDLTSATLKAVGPVGHGETVKTLRTGEQVWCIMDFHRFEVRLTTSAANTDVRPGDDLVELRWVTREELADTPQIPGSREFFEECGYIS